MENITAKVSCFARAYHHLNNAAHVFDDTAAGPLLGADYDQIAASMAQGVGFFLPGFRGSAEEGLRLIVDRQLSPSVLARSAYCEDALAREARLGCRQYLVLAAGYDTFAIRNRDDALAVYELDLPEVLADKRARIAAAGLESRGIDVPCDLAEPSWRDRLPERGFSRDKKAFASLLGISYYLDKGDFRALMEGLGGIMSEGSAVCLDYPSPDGGVGARVNQALASGAGEPMKAQYDYRELEALMEACGFLIYEHLDPGEMTRRYFRDYNRRCPERAMEAPAGVCYALAVRKM